MGLFSGLFRKRGYITITGSQLQMIMSNSNILIIDVRNSEKYLHIRVS